MAAWKVVYSEACRGQIRSLDPSLKPIVRQRIEEMDSAKGAPISKGQTVDEVADYWDEHSLAHHWEKTREAQFEVRAKRRRRIMVDPEIYSGIEAQARLRGISAETLINLWLAEHIKKHQAA